MDQARDALAKNAALAGAVGAVYKFVLEGEGGGTWVVNLKGTPGVTAGDGDAECTLKLAASDYVDMMEGRAKGEDLFFAGKLQIEGDPLLAMKLQSISELMS